MASPTASGSPRSLRPPGLTLVEVLVASTILSVALLVGLDVLLASGRANLKADYYARAAQAAGDQIAQFQAGGYEKARDLGDGNKLFDGTPTPAPVAGLPGGLIHVTVGPLDNNAANVSVKQVDVLVTWTKGQSGAPSLAGQVKASTVISDTYFALPDPGGTGLTCRYFSGEFGTVLVTRSDAFLDFSWGYGSPGASVPSDNFSARWTGKVLAPVTGTYTFATRSNDRVRLWVDGVSIINNWVNHNDAYDYSAGVSLTAGQKYDIKLDFYENAGKATVSLHWLYPGQALQVIPQGRLFP